MRLIALLVLLAVVRVNAASISGRVSDVDGKPVPFVEVRGPSGSFNSSSVTGRFLLELDDKLIGHRVSLSYRRTGWELVTTSALSAIVPADSADNPIAVRMRLLSTSSAKQDGLSFSYMRLFGAVIVPAILHDFIADPEKDGDTPGQGLMFFDQTNKVGDFLRKWPYRDARLIKSAPLEEALGSDYASYAYGDPPSDPRIRALFASRNLGEKPANWKPNHDYSKIEGTEYQFFKDIVGEAPYSVWEMVHAAEKAQQKVGFLFIVIQNNLSRRLDSVIFTLKLVQRNNGPADAALTEVKLVRAPPQRKIIAQLAPGETVMMLLAVYLKDEKGFPSSYISGVVRPLSASYSLAGASIQQKVRLPLLDEAAPIILPIGWYNQ